jgi:hypothetical protein
MEAAMADKCTEYARLENDVRATLQKLTELTTAQLQAFLARDQTAFLRLDKELELTVGIKEQTIGALRQHSKEHKCLVA